MKGHDTSLSLLVTREIILAALKDLGVQFAGREGDSRRWSVGDLATDLAPLLELSSVCSKCGGSSGGDEPRLTCGHCGGTGR